MTQPPRWMPPNGFQPNDFGLYDMHGNVCEWCADWYDAGYYANAPTEAPPGPSPASFRVNRGGSWLIDARPCRSANRSCDAPSNRLNLLGFRVARGPSGQPAGQVR